MESCHFCGKTENLYKCDYVGTQGNDPLTLNMTCFHRACEEHAVPEFADQGSNKAAKYHLCKAHAHAQVK